MFFKLYRYSVLRTVRQKLIIFWSLLFPIIMGTLFRVSFGDFMNETVVFHQISVAYVTEEGQFDAFLEVLKSLEKEEKLVEVVLAGRHRAECGKHYINCDKERDKSKYFKFRVRAVSENLSGNGAYCQRTASGNRKSGFRNQTAMSILKRGDDFRNTEGRCD